MDLYKYDDLGHEIISRIDDRKYERLESVLLAEKPVVMAIMVNRHSTPGFPEGTDEIYQLVLNPTLERVNNRYVMIEGAYIGIVTKRTFPKQAGRSKHLYAMHQSVNDFGAANYLFSPSPDIKGTYSGVFSQELDVYAAVIPVN